MGISGFRLIRGGLFWGLLAVFGVGGLADILTTPPDTFIGALVGTLIGMVIIAQVLHRALYGRFIPWRRFSPIRPAPE